MTEQDVKDRLTGRDAVACTVRGEARGEPLDGLVAVACTIRNRVNDPRRRYGVGWAGVCFKPWQFSCWHERGGPENYRWTMALARAVLAGDVTVDRRGYIVARAIAQGVMEPGGLPDSTGGATHYVTRERLERQPPAWARRARRTVEIGRHVFFAEVD